MLKIICGAAAALLPALSMAGVLGEYAIWTGQDDDPNYFCLQAGGVWYSPNFYGWTGTWQEIDGHIYMLGAISSSPFVSSMSFKYRPKSEERRLTGTWLQWTTDQTYSQVWPGAYGSLYKKDCDPPASIGAAKLPGR